MALKKRKIYLDYAAATPVDPEVEEVMKPYMSEVYANPSSLHELGQQAKKAIDAARADIAKLLHCRSTEIHFTGSGTESDNLALFGVARKLKGKANHIIISAIEHHAVLRSAEALAKEGFEITIVPVNDKGLINVNDVEAAMKPSTILVSVIYANNEIGTIQPIVDIGKLCRAKGVLFHSDGCQAAGALSLNTDMLNVDLFTINAGKIYGPKGIGLLYVKRGLQIDPIIYGGGQENGVRSGTENVAGIVGFAKALELVSDTRAKQIKSLKKLRDYFIQQILNNIEGTQLNGDAKKRLPNNVNITFAKVDGEALLFSLDGAGIYASTGSACSAADKDASHVLLALGHSKKEAEASIRFSLGRNTTKEDVDYVVEVLSATITKLRGMTKLKRR